MRRTSWSLNLSVGLLLSKLEELALKRLMKQTLGVTWPWKQCCFDILRWTSVIVAQKIAVPNKSGKQSKKVIKNGALSTDWGNQAVFPSLRTLGPSYNEQLHFHHFILTFSSFYSNFFTLLSMILVLVLTKLVVNGTQCLSRQESWFSLERGFAALFNQVLITFLPPAYLVCGKVKFSGVSVCPGGSTCGHTWTCSICLLGDPLSYPTHFGHSNTIPDQWAPTYPIPPQSAPPNLFELVHL